MAETRYYLCPVLGDGLTPETAYRLKIPKGATACRIPHKSDGSPRFGWGLAKVVAEPADHLAASTDSSLILLPLNDGRTLGQILTGPQRAAIANKLVAMGVIAQASDAVPLLTRTVEQVADFVRDKLKD